MHPCLSILLQILLWLGLAYLLYVEAGYPLLLWLLSRFRKPVHNPSPDINHPSLS